MTVLSLQYVSGFNNFVESQRLQKRPLHFPLVVTYVTGREFWSLMCSSLMKSVTKEIRIFYHLLDWWMHIDPLPHPRRSISCVASSVLIIGLHCSCLGSHFSRKPNESLLYAFPLIYFSFPMSTPFVWLSHDQVLYNASAHPALLSSNFTFFLLFFFFFF